LTLRLAASMGAVQTLVSMVLSFVSIKITSVYLGPAGLGTMGQLGLFMVMTQAILAAGVGTGLVRRTAELNEAPAQRELAISTALRMLVAAGAVTTVLVAGGATVLAREILHDVSLSHSLQLYAAVCVFGLVATAIVSCASGAKDFRSVALINIGTGVSSFAMVAALCPQIGLEGGLIATATLPLITWAIAFAVSRHKAWWPSRPFAAGFSRGEARGVVAFVPIAIITAVGMPLLQLAVRDQVIAHSGMAAVGLLQGVMRLSDMYLGIASGVFAMYFFPRFTEIKGRAELSAEIRLGLLLIVPAVAIVSLAIYLLRDLIVRLVFTPDFLPMTELFGWQMAGNTLKMVGWLLGYVLLAKANPVAMAVLETSTLILWWLIARFTIAREGVLGAPQAFAVTYALYAVATLVGVTLVLRRLARGEGATT